MAVLSWRQDEYIRAHRFAAEAHNDQKFPGTDLPYLVHINLVAMEVIAALQAEPEHDGDLAIKCALLHDVLEDTKVSYEEMRAEFGLEVADGVRALGKNPALEKSLKMADSLDRIRQQPGEVWMVKMADRITNLLPPPKTWDREKIREYKEESIEIYNKLKEASQFLAARLEAKIEAYNKL